MLLLLGGGLALAQLVHRLFEHFGVRDQIIPDDGLDVAALSVGEAFRRDGDRRAAKREGEQGRDEQTERRHLTNSSGETGSPWSWYSGSVYLFLVALF